MTPFRNHRQKSSFLFIYDTHPHIKLTPPLDAFHFDFMGPIEGLEANTSIVSTTAIHSGMCNALVVWWEIELDEEIKFSSGPSKYFVI